MLLKGRLHSCLFLSLQSLIKMDKLVKKSFPVTGMSCASCAVTVQDIVRKQKGVRDAGANYALNSVWVEYDPSAVTTASLKTALRPAGYDLVEEYDPAEADRIREDELTSLKRKTFWAAVLTLPVVVISIFFIDSPFAGYLLLLLSAPVTFWFGRKFFTTAFQLIRSGRTNMDTLVALSTGIAWLFSFFNLLFPRFLGIRDGHPQLYFEASSVIIVFILLGRYLEERAKAKTTSALKALMDLQPDTANLVEEDGSEIKISADRIAVGNLLRVKPGERIPVDGILVSGFSAVDESTITGESIPVEKQTGSKVFSGTINQKGSFIFSAEKIGKETLLSRIIQTVREAQENKPPVQKIVDKVAAVFVPAVIITAIISFAGWMVLGGSELFPRAFQAFVSVLIIACPCALGLATPTAIMVGIGKGAQRGILIKDPAGLEKSCKIDTLVFDKTGTITTGNPEVTDIWWKNGNDEPAKILHGTEVLSEHPLAEAVVSKLKKSGYSALAPDHFESLPGRGVRAKYKDNLYLAGNEDLVKDAGISLSAPEKEIVTSWQQEAKSIVYFADKHDLLAVIAIADRVKASSPEAVGKMKKVGMELHMLTGDHENTARAVANLAGISHFRANCLPADKADHISSLKQKGRVVGMVGDGINDSQALAVADVSFAMGSGSDISMDVSDMTIVTSDLNAIPAAIRLSKLTVRTIRQNLFWAFFYNVVAIPLAAGLFYPVWGIMLNPMFAGAAMAMSSVSVVTNSLWLKYRKID